MSNATTDDLEWTLKSDYELHPVGDWRAAFMGWEKDVHETFGLQIKLQFQTEVLDKEGKHREMSAWGKPSLSPKSKVTHMMLAFDPAFDPKKLTEAELKNFSRFLNERIGQKLRLQIAHKPKENAPTEFTDKIIGFLPYRKAEVKTGGFDDEPETSGDKAAQEQSKQEPVAAGKAAGKAAPKSDAPPVDPFAGED